MGTEVAVPDGGRRGSFGEVGRTCREGLSQKGKSIFRLSRSQISVAPRVIIEVDGTVFDRLCLVLKNCTLVPSMPC